jgi:uncharacterized membrane-anchored protein
MIMAAGAPLALPLVVLIEAVFPFSVNPTISGTISVVCGAVVVGFFAFGVYSFLSLLL